MKNQDLFEILKNCEHEVFWSPIYGEVVITYKCYNSEGLGIESINGEHYLPLEPNLHLEGYSDSGEVIVFPSKNQRDWNKWLEDYKLSINPKTWEEVSGRIQAKHCSLYWAIVDEDPEIELTPIEKSILALSKIHYLISKGYGGNITKKEWKNDEWKFIYQCNGDKFDIISTCQSIHVIAFHTREQAEEFLKYSENIQLLKDYFMI